MCTAGKWSRMKYFSVAHEPLASVEGFSRNLLISSFKNITRVSPGACWPVLILQPIQQRSSHHTDPRHCWHLRPTGTAVWICRGVVTYGSRKQRKRRKNSPPRLNVCSGLLPRHPAPRRSAVYSRGCFYFCFDTFCTSSRVTRDDLCHRWLLNNIGLCGRGDIWLRGLSPPRWRQYSFMFHAPLWMFWST